MKTKHLTRSHAMREATSPPRTPTPRSDRANEFSGSLSNDLGISDSKIHNQLSPTKIMDSGGNAPSVIVTSQNQTNENISNNGSVICEADFPKLTPPKSSKNSRNSSSANSTNTNTKEQSNPQNSQDSSSNRSENSNITQKNDVLLSPHRHLGGYNNINKKSSEIKTNGNEIQQMAKDPLDSPPRNDSQNSFTVDENQNDTGGRGSSSSSSTHSSAGPKKFHKINNTPTTKCSKPRLKNMGSSSSCEGGNSNSNSTSGFISRDSSSEQFTDSNGVDLIGFFKETLNKNAKDRNTLLQIEEDLIDLVDEKSRREIRFPAASSYHRMLIHRTAAFFGMDHNVDTETQTCVIVSKTRSTRIPDIRFNTLCRDILNDDQPPRKSILKRDAHSFDDPRQSFLCPERMMLDRKAKSFEEREEEYEKARTRIFRNRDSDESYWSWYNEKTDQISKLRQNKMLKVKSMSTDSRDQRPSVSKANSFGGYGGPLPSSTTSLNRGNSMNMTKSAGSRYITKQDSISGTPWRMSPSSSGYKTQTQSLRSESATPSLSGSGSCDDITTESPSSTQPQSNGIMWAVSDMASIPKGSVLIDPKTLQPVMNRDGSIYHYDPSNLPPSQGLAPGMYNSTSNKSKLQAKKNMENSNSCNSNSKKMISSSTSTNETDPDINLNKADNANLSSDTVDSSENNISLCSMKAALSTATTNCISTSEDSNDENDNEKLQTNATLQASPEFYNSDKKPLLKNQATSPKIPTPDPEDKLIEGCEILSETKASTPASTTPVQQDTKGEQQIVHRQSVAKSSNIPIMSFAPTTSYQIDGTTIYPQANNQPNANYPGTAYQQGADGNLYAIPQSLLYAYPQPMDGEIQGYFMSLYDPAIPTHTSINPGQATLYQPGAPAVVPLAAYTTTPPFSGTPFYQGPIIYSTEQISHGTSVSTGSQTSTNTSQTVTSVTSNGQISQYPLTASYPISYTYPTSGYWGQPMTYYVPQQALTNPSSGVLAHTSHAHTSNAENSKSVNNNGGSGGSTLNGKKRSTTPHTNLNSQLHQSSHHHQTSNHSVAANTTYQFASAVPLALTSATDINGQPMYAAIPAPHTFSASILPFSSTSSAAPQTPPATVVSTSAAALGVLTPITPHPTNMTQNLPGNSSPPSNQTVINTLVPTTSSSSSPTLPSLKNIQSTPSTPLSTTTSTSYLTNRNNPPLFPTPPIFVAANNGYHHYYDMAVDKRNIHSSKRNSGGYVPNGRQQHSFASAPTPSNNAHPLRKQSSIDSSSSLNNNRSNQQTKRMPLSSSNNINSNTSSDNKQRIMNNGGIYRQQKPASLDFKKSNGYSYNGQSQRNTPSTNSLESGSPNSIISSMNGSTVPSTHSTTPGQFVAPGTYVGTEYHFPSGHQGVSHQPSATTFYMTTSARGAHIPANAVHHTNPNSASGVVTAAEVANAACHQPLISTYNPHNSGPHSHNGTGMYFKYGQPYFAPTMALPNNRRSPPTEIRPSMTPLTGVFPAVNMMIQAPRQLQPRHQNPNYKGNKTR